MPRVECYEGSARDILEKAFAGKYLQNINDPKLVLYIDGVVGTSKNLRIRALNEITEKSHDIDLNELGHYVEISENQYERFVKDPSLLENITLIHKDSSFAKSGVKMVNWGLNDSQLKSTKRE